jgi:undecaprenyl diphosphate synthase
MRLSNFLIWQSAYAEYYSTPVYWPDFDEAEVDRALAEYARRGRRFGGLENGSEPNGSVANGAHRTA